MSTSGHSKSFCPNTPLFFQAKSGVIRAVENALTFCFLCLSATGAGRPARAEMSELTIKTGICIEMLHVHVCIEPWNRDSS